MLPLIAVVATETEFRIHVQTSLMRPAYMVAAADVGSRWNGHTGHTTTFVDTARRDVSSSPQGDLAGRGREATCGCHKRHVRAYLADWYNKSEFVFDPQIRGHVPITGVL